MTCDDGMEVRFDIIIKTEKGAIHAGYFKRTDTSDETAAAAPMAPMATRVKLPVRRVHQLLGHCGEHVTRATGRYLGIDIARGTLEPARVVPWQKRVRRTCQRSKLATRQRSRMGDGTRTNRS